MIYNITEYTVFCTISKPLAVPGSKTGFQTNPQQHVTLHNRHSSCLALENY